MEKTILDYLRMLRKWLWPIALFVVLSCSVTYVFSQMFVQPVYLAKSKVLVSSSYKPMESIDNNDVMMNLNLIHSYLEILRSGLVLDRVAAEHPEFGLTSEQLAGKLKATAADKSQIITIEAKDGDYGKAVLIANAVAQSFIKEVPSLMNMNNVSMLSPADPGKPPVSANAGVATNLAVSFLLSLIVALGAVFLFENMNVTIRTEKEAEHYIGLPVLAEIGTIAAGRAARQSAARSRKVGERSYVPVK